MQPAETSEAFVFKQNDLFSQDYIGNLMLLCGLMPKTV
jgi:hypothetical protein